MSRMSSCREHPPENVVAMNTGPKLRHQLVVAPGFVTDAMSCCISLVVDAQWAIGWSPVSLADAHSCMSSRYMSCWTRYCLRRHSDKCGATCNLARRLGEANKNSLWKCLISSSHRGIRKVRCKWGIPSPRQLHTVISKAGVAENCYPW